jgi:replicative DNA helicase
LVEKIPSNIEAEESTIGSVLIDNSCFSKVLSIVKSKDFYDERNSWLFESCENLYSRRESINQITVAQELERQGRLESCGGSPYLSYLISIVPTSLDAEYYAEIVKRLSTYREMINLSQSIQFMAESQPPDSNDTIGKLSEMVTDFTKNNLMVDDLITPEMAADELLKMVNEYSEGTGKGMSWGFKDLDKLTGGIYPELTIIGARPSVGKTEIMINIVETMQDKKILFVSGEMLLRGLLERKAARKLGITVVELRKGNLTDVQLSKLADLAALTSEIPLYHLPPGKTSFDIYARVEQLKSTIGVDIVFVDYLQILKDCWISNKENMRIRVGTASKTLKGIVNDFSVPVICASQLSRALEYRTDKRPTLADLRESGDIEQDADNVILLYRDMEEEPNILEAKIAKGRQTGSFPHVKLVWVEKEQRYADYFRG